MISIIAAVATNNVIGKQGDVPWYISDDLKRFKELTTGKVVLMGRKTFESILRKLGKPLPGRKNVVLTTRENYAVPEGVEVFHSMDRALAAHASEDIFVIGGAEIYSQTLHLADKLYLTWIDGVYEGDSFFPEIDERLWKKTEEEKHEGFTFTAYIRNLVMNNLR